MQMSDVSILYISVVYIKFVEIRCKSFVIRSGLLCVDLFLLKPLLYLFMLIVINIVFDYSYLYQPGGLIRLFKIEMAWTLFKKNRLFQLGILNKVSNNFCYCRKRPLKAGVPVRLRCGRPQAGNKPGGAVGQGNGSPFRDPGAWEGPGASFLHGDKHVRNLDQQRLTYLGVCSNFFTQW